MRHSYCHLTFSALNTTPGIPKSITLREGFIIRGEGLRIAGMVGAVNQALETPLAISSSREACVITTGLVASVLLIMMPAT